MIQIRTTIIICDESTKIIVNSPEPVVEKDTLGIRKETQISKIVKLAREQNGLTNENVTFQDLDVLHNFPTCIDKIT